MSIPINKIDSERFLKLYDLLKNNTEIKSKSSPGTSAEMKIYTSKNPHEGITYVSLDISGYVLTKDVEAVFNSVAPENATTEIKSTNGTQ